MPAAISIQISGLAFELTPPFSSGHQCSEAEAAVLNQAWIDNIRTNFGKRVQSADKSELPDIQQEFAEYVAGYSFKSSGPRSIVDPVQREAQKIAKARVVEHLNSKGQRQHEIEEGLFAAMVERVCGHPAVQAEARRRVEALTAVSGDIFELGEL